MSRFRLFGRAPTAGESDPWAAGAGPWTAVGTGGGPATAGARPAQPGWVGHEPAEPATDPYGLPVLAGGPSAAAPAAAGVAPPVIPGAAGYGGVPAAGMDSGSTGVRGVPPAAGGVPATEVPGVGGPSSAVVGGSAPAVPPGAGMAGSRGVLPDPAPGLLGAVVAAPPGCLPAAGRPAEIPDAWSGVGPGPAPTRTAGPDPAEAGALAAAFAADYLSWDQDDPSRRGQVLGEYLASDVGPSARLGWSGRGRQRVEISLPGRVRPDGDDRLLVDVRVRVTPYRRVGGPVDSPVQAPPEVPGSPAAAPPPTARGWRGLASYWIRLSVPIARDGERLVVDVDEETLDEPLDPPEPAPDGPGGDDPTLDDYPPAVGGAR